MSQPGKQPRRADEAVRAAAIGARAGLLATNRTKQNELLNCVANCSERRITRRMARHEEELIPTRASLLGRLKDWNDQSSWQDFFDTYWKLIYGVARKAGLSDAEAQDVVQETLASVAKHMPAFRYDPVIGSFKAWLLNMTRWRILDQARKRAPFVARTFDAASTSTTDELVDPAGQALEAVWAAEWEKNLLDAAVAKVKRRVDPENYQIFDFYVNKAWTADKVATTFGTSTEHVYLVKHRVTEMLKQEVERLEKEIT